jgi:1-acyl-sn-glycerol-3-phosphate acyltransferase
LWGEDPERLWPLIRLLVRPVHEWIAPSIGYGVDRIPLEGGAVLTANHLAAIDHTLVGAHCPRPVRMISKVELLQVPVLGTLLRWGGVFPVRRGSPDRDALKHATEMAASGRLVLIHPEGTRQWRGYPGEFKRGAAMVALRAGVPVVPCGLETHGWSLRNRRRVALVWGDPIRLDGIPATASGSREATGVIRAEIVRLWRLAGEAVAAGFPPVLPDGARGTPPVPALGAAPVPGWAR